MAKRNTMIGQTVLWYPEANTTAGARPALVTGPEYEHPDGILNLTIFREHATSLDTARNVRHVDDPVLTTHPRMKRAGGWEFSEKPTINLYRPTENQNQKIERTKRSVGTQSTASR